MEITNERYEELIKTEMLYRMTKNALKIGVPYPHILAMLGGAACKRHKADFRACPYDRARRAEKA